MAPEHHPTVTKMDATPIPKPGQPLWQTHAKWRDNRIRSDAKAGLLMIWFFAVVFLGFGIGLAAIIPEELEKENIAVLFALVFPLAGLGMAISAIHKTLEWRRFGPLALVMDPFPGSLGGDVGGTIDLRERYDPNFEYKVTLACSRVYVSGTGKNRSTHTDVIWDQAGSATATPTIDGSRLAFRFAPPEDLPESELKSSDYRRWTVRVHGSLPGVDLQRAFEVPVFRTGGERTRQRLADAHEKLLEEAPPAPPERLVRMTRDPYGLSLHYPAFRHIGPTLMIALFAAAFLGFGAVWAHLSGDIPAGSATGLLMNAITLSVVGVIFVVGGLMAAAAVYMLGKSLDVQVTPEEIVAERRLFGVPMLRRTIGARSVVAIDTKVGLRTNAGSRSTKYERLVARGAAGEKVTVADGLNDPAAIKQIRAAIIHVARLDLPE